MNRLTVSQIFNIREATTVGQDFHIQSIFFTDNFIYMIEQTNPKVLRKISIKKFETIEEITLPEVAQGNNIKSLGEVNGIVVFAVLGEADLFFINSKRQTIRIKSHIEQINKVIRYQNSIATCSDDYTVRIWDQTNGQIIQSKVKHAYYGHAGKVTCLQTSYTVLASGSDDGSVIFWKKNQFHSQYKCSSPIKNLLKCGQSNQFITFSKNGQISILSLSSIMKSKKVEVLRKIQYKGIQRESFCNLFQNCFQVDDSFVLFTEGNSIVFAQINIGQIINQKQLSQKSQDITGLKCIGRVLIYGKRQQNLYLLRF